MGSAGACRVVPLPPTPSAPRRPRRVETLCDPARVWSSEDDVRSGYGGSIRCRSRGGRWRRSPCCSFSSFRSRCTSTTCRSGISYGSRSSARSASTSLVGYTGQVSIGHGAFMSVSTYTAANLANRLDSPWPVNLVAGGLMAAPWGRLLVFRRCASRGSTRDREAGRRAHHRVDDQPLTLISGAFRLIEVRGRGWARSCDSQRADVLFPLVFVVLPIVGRSIYAKTDRARLRRDSRRGRCGRDHRHRCVPLQALGLRHLPSTRA